MRFLGWLVLVLSGLFYAGVSAATFETDNDTMLTVFFSGIVLIGIGVVCVRRLSQSRQMVFWGVLLLVMPLVFFLNDGAAGGEEGGIVA